MSQPRASTACNKKSQETLTMQETICCDEQNQRKHLENPLLLKLYHISFLPPFHSKSLPRTHCQLFSMHHNHRNKTHFPYEIPLFLWFIFLAFNYTVKDKTTNNHNKCLSKDYLRMCCETAVCYKLEIWLNS